NFHHEKTAIRRTTAVGTISRDTQAISFDGDFEILAFHAGQFDFDDDAGVRGVNVRVGNPVTAGCAVMTPAHRRAARSEMNRRTDFGYGHDENSSAKIRLSKHSAAGDSRRNIIAK